MTKNMRGKKELGRAFLGAAPMTELLGSFGFSLDVVVANDVVAIGAPAAPAGTTVVRVTVDGNNTIEENDETNNVMTVAAQPAAGGGPPGVINEVLAVPMFEGLD